MKSCAEDQRRGVWEGDGMKAHPPARHLKDGVCERRVDVDEASALEDEDEPPAALLDRRSHGVEQNVLQKQQACKTTARERAAGLRGALA